jgi:hypothetical protein
MSAEIHNRAWMNISGEFLAELIGLPKGVRIIRADTYGFDFGVRLGLEGPGMPEVAQGAMIPDIWLNFYVDEADGIRKIFAAFSHKPDDKWLIREEVRQPTPEQEREIDALVSRMVANKEAAA